MENKLNYFMLLVLLLIAGMLKAEEPEKKKEILFDVIKAPSITIAELDKEIVLNWSGDTNISVIENYYEKGYSFQGYNIYQFANPSDDLYEGKKIATYDIVDGIDSIWDFDYNPDSGKVLLSLIQRGTDSGIQRYISIKTDALNNNAPLHNGSKYYYGVSAYVYNPDTNAVPRSLETAIKIYTAIPRYNEPNGEDDVVNSGELASSKITHEGSADASVKVLIVDPSQLKEIDYAVTFKNQALYRDKNGKKRYLNPGAELINLPSYIYGAAIYGEAPGQYEVKLIAHLNSSTSCNGAEFTFPAGTTINKGSFFSKKNAAAYQGVISGSVITFGDRNLAGDGILGDFDILSINMDGNTATLPFSVSYAMYDETGMMGEVVIDSIYFEFGTMPVWNLSKANLSQSFLTNQTIINRTDFWEEPPVELTSASDPVVNGLQVMVNGSYDIPLGFSSAVLYSGAESPRDVEGTSVSSSSIVISNMNVFSEVATSMAADESLDLKRGTSKLSILQKDIELRFTGVWNELGADSVATIKDGTGSVATLFLMRGAGASLANNPLNPNPGVNEPFTVRIPFEAWDITDNRQINVMVVDRFQNPVQKPYYAWNPNNRMYFYLVETPYSETVIKPADSEADSASWAMAAWSLHYKIGDIVKIKYTNPIRPGKDVFRFSTNASVIEIKDDGIGAPKEYSLSQNYPNPFNPATTINFAVPKAGNVKITVYDMLGREIEILTNKEYSIGAHKIEWNASRYSSGVYFYRLESAGFSLAKKMLLIK